MGFSQLFFLSPRFGDITENIVEVLKKTNIISKGLRINNLTISFLYFRFIFIFRSEPK